MTRWWCPLPSILILTLAWSAYGHGAEPTLGQRLAPLAKAHRGKVSIAVKHLDGGPSYFLNADQPMPAAGLIQLPIMVEVYQQAAEDNVKLTDRLTLQEADKVPGSGILAAGEGPGRAVFYATRTLIACPEPRRMLASL